jgi:hypothetical protein
MRILSCWLARELTLTRRQWSLLFGWEISLARQRLAVNGWNGMDTNAVERSGSPDRYSERKNRIQSSTIDPRSRSRSRSNAKLRLASSESENTSYRRHDPIGEEDTVTKKTAGSFSRSTKSQITRLIRHPSHPSHPSSPSLHRPSCSLRLL